MTNPLPLFDLTPAANPAAPRCRMCTRPARWLNTQQHYAMYCAGNQCSNRERICQICGKPFTILVDGAGTKYCSTECKVGGYEIRHPKAGRPNCAWCGKAQPYEGTRRRPTIGWPYICQTCLDPIKYVIHSLKAHHVPHERARRLLDDPGCEICGTNLLAKVKERSHGQAKVLLTVDHDHNCCPVTSHSCGRCVRGLICRDCNTSAGLLADEPKRARALGDYLEAWINR